MKKSSEMPEPQTFNYAQCYKVTPLFVNDFKKVMANVPYAEAKKLLDVIEEHEYILPSAVLNEFLKSISSMPYKYVCGLMNVINNPDNFLKYFNLINTNANSGQ